MFQQKAVPSGGSNPARPGELGCFHHKALPSVGTPSKAQVGLDAICTPLLPNTPPLCFFADSFFETLWNFTYYVTTPIFFPECCETLRIAQQCFPSTSGMLRNFTDFLTMGIKYLEVVNRRLHAPNDGPQTKLGYDSCPSLLIFYLR